MTMIRVWLITLIRLLLLFQIVLLSMVATAKAQVDQQRTEEYFKEELRLS
jgi:hypothetical protein